MTAEKITVGYLPGSDPEAALANMETQKALERLQEALESRKNRMFDPQMLALAQGFLAPTKTGGFGESLGYATKNLQEAQAQAEKEEREIAQAQLGLASKGIELQRQKAREQLLRSMYGPQPSDVTGLGMPTRGAMPPAGGALPTGQPKTPGAEGASQLAGGALPSGQPKIQEAEGALASLNMPAAPAGFSPTEGIQTMPVNYDMLNRIKNIRTIALAEPGVSPLEIEQALQKIAENRFQKTENAVHDTLLGKTYYTSTETKPKQVLAPVYNEDGDIIDKRPMTINMTARDAAELDLLSAKGDPSYFAKVERIMSGPPLPKAKAKEGELGKEKAPERPGARPAGGRMKSVEELEVETAGAKKTAELEATRQTEEKKEVLERAGSYSSRVNAYDKLGKFAANPNADIIFGVFEKPGIVGAMNTLIEGGIGTEKFRVTLPTYRKALTAAGIPKDRPELLDMAQESLGLMAQVQLETSRLGQGQGQVSNFERELFEKASLSMSDRPNVVLAKLNMLRMRADFDRQVARELRAYKGNIDDFYASDSYQNRLEKYEQDLKSLVDNSLAGPYKPRSGVTVPGSSAAASGRDNRGAASRLGI